ncbi:MAG: cation transporter [Planctomycetota bacterium]
MANALPIHVIDGGTLCDSGIDSPPTPAARDDRPEHDALPATTNGSASSAATDANSVLLQISGMHCAGCVARVEKALGEQPGVRHVAVSLSEETAKISGEHLRPDRLADVVRTRGFEAAPVMPREKAASVAEQRTALEHRQYATARKWRNRVIVGLCAWIPLAVIHWGGKPLGWYTGHHPEGALLWVQVALAFTILIYVGGLFYQSAWKAAKAKSTNMDTLIAIGATAAFSLSLFVTILTVLGKHAPFPL